MVHGYVRAVSPTLALVCCQAGIELYQYEFAAQWGYVFGECSCAGAYFHDAVIPGNFELADNPARYVFVHQEVLPHGFGGGYSGGFQYPVNLRGVHARVL